MLNRELLEKLDFDNEDIEYIMERDKKYGSKISEFSSGFMNAEKTPENRRRLSDEFMQKALDTASGCDNQYIIRLLFWLYCVPFAKEYYEKNNISTEVFYDTMKDISCKAKECRKTRKMVGCYSPYFYLHFDYVYFALGRLQFYVESYIYDTYSRGGYTLKTGDRIYSCHIPSGSRLSKDSCMESFQKAYEFFGAELKGDILPIICTSWLLYPPYIERVFKEGSNIDNFAKMFDIIGQYEKGNRFTECEGIFGVPYEGSTEGFPSDNSLRRNMIRYIDSGSPSGHGIGIILYDGKKQRIVK